MYEARDKAFLDWLTETRRLESTAHERDLLKRAFHAGWKARKTEQYTMLLERSGGYVTPGRFEG